MTAFSGVSGPNFTKHG